VAADRLGRCSGRSGCCGPVIARPGHADRRRLQESAERLQASRVYAHQDEEWKGQPDGGSLSLARTTILVQNLSDLPVRVKPIRYVDADSRNSQVVEGSWSPAMEHRRLEPQQRLVIPLDWHPSFAIVQFRDAQGYVWRRRTDSSELELRYPAGFVVAAAGAVPQSVSAPGCCPANDMDTAGHAARAEPWQAGCAEILERRQVLVVILGAPAGLTPACLARRASRGLRRATHASRTR
jgi:hypothetical protein